MSRAATAATVATPLALTGLTAASPQEWGSIRLIPLLRTQVREDLRLFRQRYPAATTVVTLTGTREEPELVYMGFVPHGLVMSWSDDGSPVAAFGSQLVTAQELEAARTRKSRRDTLFGIRLEHRMIKREGENRLRFLPLHLALEGFLAFCFGGPDIAWAEYSRRVLRHGLDPRSELVSGGRAVHKLEEALRVFEIHENQCGLLLCVADALAAAFMVPHPEDYRLLHRALIEDVYGELIVQYSRFCDDVPSLRVDLGEELPAELGALRSAIAAARDRNQELAELIASGLAGRTVRAETLYRAGPFRLERFMTPPALDAENHIGERIVREDGELQYLKTFRLSAAQGKRAYLLETLSRNSWRLDESAAELRNTTPQLVERLEQAGLGYLLADRVISAIRKGR